MPRDGSVSILSLVHDITVEVRGAELDAWLSDASKRLAESLDLAQTLRTIATVPLPLFADFCRVDLADADGRIRTEAIAHVDAERNAALQRWVHRYPIVIRGRLEVPGRIRGLPLFWPISEPVVYESSADDAGHVVFAGEAYVLSVPLIAHGTVLGALTFALCDSTRRYYDGDRRFAAELAYRCALAIDNARLFEREHRVADTLQRAMLPASAPKVPGLSFSTAYSPAAAESEVGGDWYDAFALGDGRVAVSIGDVTGHGLLAAVVMGSVRQSIHAAALGDSDPAVVLERANRMLLQHDRATIVTAIFGIIDPAAGTFTYATAGHPPPLLADSGGVHALDCAGLPLGLRGPEDTAVFTVDLERGALLVLYTDGLIEFSRDLLGGERALAEAVAAEYASPSRDPAQSIKERVLARKPQTDDIAILVAAVAPRPVRSTWTLPARDRAQAHAIRRDISELLREHARAGCDLTSAEVAIGELLANAVEHAPGDVEIVLDWTMDEAVIIVGDLGADVPTRGALPADPLAERGRGLYLLGRLARGFSVMQEPGGVTRLMAVLNVEREVASGRTDPEPDPSADGVERVVGASDDVSPGIDERRRP